MLDLLADAAPNHVAHFITRAREGAYDGTTFHRVIAMGIIQGGDPLSKDPAQAAKYGTGGLGVLRFEPNAEKHTRGAVSAVLVPGNRDSAGSQFFICVTDQPALDGQYTVFARVAEGINVAQKISTVAGDRTRCRRSAIEIRKVTIRDKPAPVPEPFVDETVEELATAARGASRRRWATSRSSSFPTARRTTCASSCGWRRPASTTAPRSTASSQGFVIQGGHMPTRREPLDEQQQALRADAAAGVQRRRRTSAASCRWRAATIRPAPRSSFFIVLAPHAGARRPVHGVRPRRRRAGRGREDRGACR